MTALTLGVCTVPQAQANGGGQPSLIPFEDADNYRSVVRGLRPPLRGLQVEVVASDDLLRVVNRTRRTVSVLGYEREPFLRFLTNGTVEANRRSASTHTSQERFGRVKVPRSADPEARPDWIPVSDQGEAAWHDHRIQWMRAARPPGVVDVRTRTKIFDWTVPARVGRRAVRIQGSLFWVPDAPAATSGRPKPDRAGEAAPFVVVAMSVLTALAIAGVVVVTRRMKRSSEESSGGKR